MGDVQGTWRMLRNFSRKELRKLRVTRAVAARITSKLVSHCDLLNVFSVFLSFKLVARFSPNALWGGAVTKSRLYVECVSDDMDDDLGICSEDMDDDMDTGVIS